MPIAECFSVIKEESEGTNEEDPPQKNVSSAAKIKSDNNFVINKLKDKFIYVTELKQMYRFEETH